MFASTVLELLARYRRLAWVAIPFAIYSCFILIAYKLDAPYLSLWVAWVATSAAIVAIIYITPRTMGGRLLALIASLLVVPYYLYYWPLLLIVFITGEGP